MVSPKAALERLYNSKCWVFEQVSLVNPDTFVTSQEIREVHSGISCHLSFGNSPSISMDETVGQRLQKVKLFLSPDVLIKSGSRINVLQNGVEYHYMCSGESLIYETHQEVSLTLFECFA